MPSRPIRTLAAVLLGASLLAACGEDGDDAAVPADEAPATDEGAPGDLGSNDGDAQDGSSGQGGGEGTLEVDGTTYTFTATSCVFSPEDPTSFVVGGPGTDGDGNPAHVDAVGPNQLTVYVGTDDPFGDAEAIIEFNPGAIGGDLMANLDGLSVDGSTIVASPEMVRTDPGRTAFDPVGAASFEVTC